MGRQGYSLVLMAGLVAALAGCGLGPGRGTSHVTMTITRGFGSVKIGSATEARVPGSETVMRMLERSFRVSTEYSGGFVESINGDAGDSSRHDWFYYVNGIEASQGAATTAVHAGDQIWWDLHDWSATYSIPAVVGSYPEPFLRGINGKRFPTVLECAPDVTTACKRVSMALAAIRVPIASQLIGTGSGSDSLAIAVGTWDDVRPQVAAELVAKGPASSGVYARFAGPNGDSLQLLDPHGKVVRTLGAGAGLIAATGNSNSKPEWLITGTDAAGVAAAAAAMTPAHLRDHFALAVDGSAYFPVPLRAT